VPAPAADLATAPPGRELPPTTTVRSGRVAPAPAWALALLVVLVAGSFALRAWDASQGLNAGAHFDERFSLRNVGGILKHGDWRPRQAFYPSLSYLPQTAVLFASEALHRATGIASLGIYGKTADGWSPTAYLLCRLTNAAFGAASLVLLFVVGRRAFGTAEGLLAAAALAAFPRHVISSTHFKPDILVVLLTLLTFHWTLLAAERPRRSAFLRTGLGVGLAASAKYTGAGAAVAPVVAVLARWRDRRQWGWLALAGVVSAATFVALNPWLNRLLTFAQNLSHGYAAAGVQEKSDRWVVLRREGVFLVSHHGWALAIVLVAGMAGLAWGVARPAAVGWDASRRMAALLLLGQILGYAVLHALGFPLFRGQNFLPVAPFTSLVAAWAMVAAWRALCRAVPPLGRPAIAAAIWAVPTTLLAAAQVGVVYRAVVPTNWAAASGALAEDLDHLVLRQVVYEGSAGQLRSDRATRAALAIPVNRLDAVRPDFLDLADAEVVAQARLSDPFVAARAARPGTATRTVTAHLLASRGEPVALLVHPWRLTVTRRLAWDAPAAGESPPPTLTATLPPTLRPGDVVTLALWLPRMVSPPGELRLEPAGTRLRLFPTDRLHGDQRVVTGRLALPAGAERVVVSRPAKAPRPVRIELYRWSRP
jgi:4-amino-4-deoxy-L-arabinose transferase-like glycosyltransferase